MLNKLKENLSQGHFYVIAMAVFFQTLTIGEAYRFFAYTNLVFVVMLLIFRSESSVLKDRAFWWSVFSMVTFVGLEWLATANYSLDIKAVRHLLLSIGLMLGLGMLVKPNNSISTKIMPVLIIATYGYVLCQLAAIYLFNHPYGTTKNPHYLAIYSAIFMVVAGFLATKKMGCLHQCLLSTCVVVLGALLIYSSSRPTWIAVAVACVMGAVCLHKQARLLFSAIITVILLVLSLTNAGNFKGRVDDLVMHAHTEERVTIWQDTWKMQQASATWQWAIGHGVEGFEHDFPTYSRYHSQQHIDFNSPHNAVLEILYLFGMTGLLCIFGFLVWLYQALFSRYFTRYKHSSVQWVYLLLAMILTIDLLTVGITLPFFISINLNIIAIVIGIMLYLDRVNTQYDD